jgi:hypothetical protein
MYTLAKTLNFKIFSYFIFIYLFIFCYISLTLHLGIILVNNQLDVLFSLYLFIYLFHFSTCFEQPNAYHQENQTVSLHHLVYITLEIVNSLFHYTHFIIPDGFIVLIQFCFDVLLFVYLFCLFGNAKFYISLTLHLGIIIVNNQLDALFSVYLFISFFSLHISSNPVLIIRRIELYHYIIWYISLWK